MLLLLTMLFHTAENVLWMVFVSSADPTGTAAAATAAAAVASANDAASPGAIVINVVLKSRTSLVNAPSFC